MLLALLLATAAPDSGVPTAADLSAAVRRHGASAANIRTKSIRRVRCEPFKEEPTEFHCSFRAQNNRGIWKKRAAIVTYDKGWLLLDFE
ncbi:MAG: hypothetical protein ACJ8FB_13190 [Sphingomicrobium sp.]